MFKLFDRRMQTVKLRILGRVIAAPLLAPGRLSCNLNGVADEGARGLMRMLVNSVARMVLGVVVVIGSWGES